MAPVINIMGGCGLSNKVARLWMPAKGYKGDTLLAIHIIRCFKYFSQEKWYINTDSVFTLNCLSSMQKRGQYLYTSLSSVQKRGQYLCTIFPVSISTARWSASVIKVNIYRHTHSKGFFTKNNFVLLLKSFLLWLWNLN